MHKIVEVEDLKISRDHIHSTLGKLLEADGFDIEKDIPNWLIHFFLSIQTKKEIYEKFRFQNSKTCDPFDLIEELSNLINFEYTNNGEDLTMKFKNLRIEGYISIESGIYSTRLHDDTWPCT